MTTELRPVTNFILGKEAELLKGTWLLSGRDGGFPPGVSSCRLLCWT